MLKLIRKVALTVFLASIGAAYCNAQTNTVSSGNWSDPTVWSTGAVPGGATTVNVTIPLVLDQNLTITTGTYSFFQNVTDLPGGTAYTLTANTAGGVLDVKAGTTTFEGAAVLNNSTLIVRTGATLITGAFTLNNNATVTVESGGTLIINGSFANNNNGSGTFTVAGLVQVNGSYTAAVGSVNIIGTGSFFTTGTINTNGSSDVFTSQQDCTTGPCSGRNLCNFANTIAASQTICSGSTPAALSGVPVGGGPIYLWESSTTSAIAGFATASGTTNGQNYTPGALAQTTWFRRSATNGGCTGISVTVQITVSALSGGWIGTTSNWNTASNWCNNTVPTATTDVSISTGVPNQPSITAASFCRNLVINSGASVTLTGGNTFSISGSLTNNGTFTSTIGGVNQVTFGGTSQQTISGANPVTFDELIINNSFGTSPQILVSNFFTAATRLTMTAGNLNLSGYNVTLGTSAASTGTLLYSTGWFYNGNITRWMNSPVIADGNSRGLFPLGSSSNTRPFYVSFPVTVPTTGGTIRVGHTGATTTSTVSVADTGGPIVRRQDSYWQVATATLAGGTYNLRGEGTGFGTVGAVSDLRLMLAGSVVGTAGANSGTVTNPQVLRTGLTLANLANSFYIGSVNAVNSPLPITLTEFYGIPGKGTVTLKWKTESEDKFDYFQVQRSKDGQEFQVIGEEKGMGTSTTPASYSYLDTNPFSKNYYRLKIIDLDGTSSFTKVILVNSIELTASLAVYPNPITNRKFTVDFNDGDASKAQIILVDLLGKSTLTMEMEGSRQEVELPASIGPGIYFLRISKGMNQQTVKIIIH